MFNKSEDTTIILKNVSYLSVLRLTNIGVKFLLVAYLIRILGENNYGVYTWSDAVIQFFLIFINFGFNIYAAKYIVENKHDHQRTNEITSAIFTIKFVLFIFSIFILFVFSFIDTIFGYREILYLMLFLGLGEVLFPIWYFQGIEKLKLATYITVFYRLLLVLLTFLLIKRTTDLLLYVFLTVLTNILMGLTGYMVLVKSFNFKYYLLPLKKLTKYAREAYMFFISTFLSMSFNYFTIFLIGAFFIMDKVAGFDISLKIVLVAVVPFDMLQQAVYPTIARNKDRKLLKKILFLSVFAGLLFTLILYLFSEEILQLFGGTAMIKYAIVLRALAIIIPFVALTFVLGTCTLVAFGYNKEFNRSLIISSVVYFIFIGILYVTESITFWNLVWLRVLSDVILALIRLYFVYEKKILID